MMSIGSVFKVSVFYIFLGLLVDFGLVSCIPGGVSSGLPQQVTSFQQASGGNIDTFRNRAQNISKRVVDPLMNRVGDRNSQNLSSFSDSNDQKVEAKSFNLMNIPMFGSQRMDNRSYWSIPFTRDGHCEKGTIYNITSIDDLSQNSRDLMCILEVGMQPDKIPTGMMYGKMLDLFTDTKDIDMRGVDRFWGGKFAAKGVCNRGQDDVVFGYNMVKGKFTTPSVMYLSNLPQHCGMAATEHQDDSQSLILDYMTDKNQVCRAETYTNDPFFSKSEHLNVCAIVKAVGRQPDGGLILLGRGLSYPTLRPNVNPAGLITVLFFAVVTYDNVLPEFTSGTPLEPLPASFDYRLVGVDKDNNSFFPAFGIFNKGDALSLSNFTNKFNPSTSTTTTTTTTTTTSTTTTSTTFTSTSTEGTTTETTSTTETTTTSTIETTTTNTNTETQMANSSRRSMVRY
ncbi:mucin-like protein [Cryptosporidium canis]|uniref:Mucin-like protein n=1 Tax=Cryptosporidium canis TaxID=195482 RepID=A0A9D5DES9_9CRYT|nr:mucin-like protein [Cryptosporidium canis]